VALPFPARLHTMVTAATRELPGVLSWLPDGDGFAVVDERALVDQVLPRFKFKASKIASFQRNLNIYGFQRLIKGHFAGAYFHERFHRDMTAGELVAFNRASLNLKRPDGASGKHKKRASKKPFGVRRAWKSGEGGVVEEEEEEDDEEDDEEVGANEGKSTEANGAAGGDSRLDDGSIGDGDSTVNSAAVASTPVSMFLC